MSRSKNLCIGILSTARKISVEEVLPAVNWLEKFGYKVVLGETIGAFWGQFAGDDYLRAYDLQQMISSEEIDIIWCARGGYGTARIIDRIDFSPLLHNPKWVTGYSDVTALHSELNVLGIKSLHATMPVNIETNTNAALQSLLDIWSGKPIRYTWQDDVSNHKKQLIEAEVVGGNLSVIYSLLGSKSSINTQGKILFLEDLDEYLYHIDRMMLNLKRNGYLSDLKALIVGGMTQMHDNLVPFGQTAQDIILSHTTDFNYPVIFSFPAGHLADNKPFILGQKARLYLNQSEVVFEQTP